MAMNPVPVVAVSAVIQISTRTDVDEYDDDETNRFVPTASCRTSAPVPDAWVSRATLPDAYRNVIRISEDAGVGGMNPLASTVACLLVATSNAMRCKHPAPDTAGYFAPVIPFCG